MSTSRKQQVVDLLKSLETKNPVPVRVCQPEQVHPA
jgi:hypothetical protein